MYQNSSRVLAVLAIALLFTAGGPLQVFAANVSQIDLDPNSLHTVQFSLSKGDAVESTSNSSASRSTSVLNGYVQATDVNSTSATVTLVRNVNMGLEDARFCTVLPSHASKSVAPLSDFLLSYTIPSNLAGYSLSFLPKTVDGKKNLIIPMSPYSNPTGYSIQIPRDGRDYDLAENRNALDVCQPSYNPKFFMVGTGSGTGTGIGSGTNGVYVSATFKVGDVVVVAPSGYRTWVTLTLTSISNGRANFTLNPQASDNDIHDSTASFNSRNGVGSTDTNSTVTTGNTGGSSMVTGSTGLVSSSFNLPARTAGMSATDYYTSVQASYQNALNQMQSLAQQYAAQVQGISQQSSTQTQDVTSSNAQFTSSQDNLSALSNQLLALQLRLLNGSASGSTGSVTQAPASPTAAPAPTTAQGCGNAGYENVDGAWKYVGCSGYYGQGPGNQQVDVAAGYKGADPANAVQGSLGHYDENGVYYADAKFDRARDADPNVDVRAGQLGVDYCPLSNGSKTICSVSYYDPEGIKLTQTPFNPAAMLTVMDRFGIDRTQLVDLEEGMDKKNIPHLPYQMYPGTGSDAGINLTDLANGGLGTAYDWRVDPLCQSKGPTACQQVKANAQLANNLDIAPTPGVTKTNVTPLEAQLNDIKRQAVEIQTKI